MMAFTSSIFFAQLFELLVLFIFIFIVLAIIKILGKSSIRYTLIAVFKRLILPCFSISLLGLVLGIMSGNSRDGIMDVLVPGILSLLGGYSVYLFTSQKSVDKLVLNLIIICFSFFVLVGTWIGSENRGEIENQQSEYSQTIEKNRILDDLYKYEQMKIIDNKYKN